MEPSGYSLDPLREDGEFILYRAHPEQIETLSVLVLRTELDAMWAVRPLALSQQDERMRWCSKTRAAKTLDRFHPGTLEMTRFLRLAVGAATALSGVHKRQVIHQDVKPTNILLNSETGHVRLTGFGIASRLSRERQSPEAPELIRRPYPNISYAWPIRGNVS